MIYQGSEGSSTLGKPVLPWRKVNVLVIYTKSNHEYRLFYPTAVVHNADWLDLNTFPPVEDTLPKTKSLLNTWKKWLHSDGNSMFWPCYWITPWIHTFWAHCSSIQSWLASPEYQSTHGASQDCFDSVWPEHWLTLMAKPVFQVLRSLMHLGRSSLMVKMCPGGVSQHCLPSQLDQKSVFMV